MAHAAYCMCSRNRACPVILVVEVFTGRANIFFCGLLFVLHGE